MIVKKIILFCAILSCISVSTFAQTKEQIESYVESHKAFAVSEMLRTGVPASVTLAQGILETAAGTSPLYLRSNNNFGIKCKSNWTGKFTYHDDDAKGECFRVYDNDSLSYVDHSNFLRTASRYNFLFELDKTDYKGWAIGLRKAGYATNPSYASIVIKHIEENNLQQYDAVRNMSSSSGIALMKRSKQTEVASTENLNSSSSPSANLPTAEINTNDEKVNAETYPVVHWNVSNVSDATNGYTTTPIPGNAQPVYSSRTKSRYTKAKLHNISYGKSVAKNKKIGASKNSTMAKNNATKSKTNVVAKLTPKKKSTTSASALGTKKYSQHYTRN
ncbi:MAG: hypothetical protein RJA07_791 [Bacteroidota bacterium]|jgi:hypothetical protein